MRSRRADSEFMRELSALLKARGINSMGVAEIAARLRCSRRRLYQVAETKEGLLIAVAEENFDEALLAGFDAAGRETDAASQITAYLHAGITLAETISPAFLADLEASPAGRTVFDRYQTARAEGLRGIIEAGIARGELVPHNARVAAEVALGAAMRLRRPEFLRTAGLSINEAFKQAYELILNGMLARPAAATAKRAPRQVARRRTDAIV